MTASSKSILKVGDHAPDFTLPVVGSEAGPENLSLSDYKGKKVIVFMWASW